MRVTYYLPKEKVAAAQRLLMTGDIVGVTTSIEGLDCAHSGVCYRTRPASRGSCTRRPRGNAVVLDEDLATYVASVRTHSGIMVARPLEAT
mgnify:CR=1 FL=1